VGTEEGERELENGRKRCRHGARPFIRTEYCWGGGGRAVKTAVKEFNSIDSRGIKEGWGKEGECRRGSKRPRRHLEAWSWAARGDRI
jgi:hypothetical protein